MTSRFMAVVHKEANIYVAECPEVGTVSQGYSFDEAITNLKEATELYLEEVKFIPSSPAIITTFEAAINA